MKLCLLFLLCWCAVHADLDADLQAFLKSVSVKSKDGPNPEAVKTLFGKYKNTFPRSLKEPIGDDDRLNAFNRTLNTIIEHQQRGDKTMQLGLTEFADWTDNERNKLCGYKEPTGPYNKTSLKPGEELLTWDRKKVTLRAALPSSYDLTNGVVSGTSVRVTQPIKQQGTCGSCYAFAFITLLEFQLAVIYRMSYPLSEQQFVDCSTATGNAGCNGGNFVTSYSYLQKNLFHVEYSAYYGYLGYYSCCRFRSPGDGTVGFPKLGYIQVPAMNAATIQQYLYNYGPVWVSIFAGSSDTTASYQVLSLFSSYKGGIFQPSVCQPRVQANNHAVVIVGYGVDAATGIPFWKVRNSWGISWGEQGYFRIRRGVNMCGIESTPFIVGRAY